MVLGDIPASVGAQNCGKSGLDCRVLDRGDVTVVEGVGGMPRARGQAALREWTDAALDVEAPYQHLPRPPSKASLPAHLLAFCF